MEILFLLLIIAVGIVTVKLIFWLLKAGIFLLVLPAKIMIGLVLFLTLVILIPSVILPAVLAVVIPLLPIILVLFGAALLVKYAL
jgi:hypothetical protein